MDLRDSNLQEISAKTVRMLSLLRESTELAKRALLDAEVEAVERCRKVDEDIDALQAELEQTILTVIARHQPAARDLRFLGAIYRALADIERAGDYALHVADTAAELAQQAPLKKYLDMARILEILSQMVETTIKALADSDVDSARNAHAMDDEIDELYEQIQRELVTYMIESPKTINQALKLLSVGRYLERLGDHLENVNEHLLFWLTGERL